jgi:uncharacterized membrane protein YeaQ/YmgE (transglycosylase-associated protein family)
VISSITFEGRVLLTMAPGGSVDTSCTTAAEPNRDLGSGRRVALADHGGRTMADFIGTVIGALIVGTIIGFLGRLVVPGRQDISIVMTIGIGIVAALIGGFIAQLLGVGDTDGIDWIKLIIQVALAALGVGAFAASRR